jgi:hypothetical protein
MRTGDLHKHVYVFLLFLVLAPMLVFSQEDPLVLEPFGVSGVYLNAQIDADSLTRTPNRVYVLRRGDASYYFLNTVITNTGYTLRIRAEEGSGRRPVIYLYGNPFPTHFVQMAGDLLIKDLIVCGFAENIEGEIANDPPRMIRAQTAGLSFTMDGCLLTETRGELLRFEQSMKTCRITNSVFANQGDLGGSNLGAGKPMDFRNAAVDSIIIENNTFVNFQDRLVRHRGSIVPINYFKFDHNTAVNSLGYHGTMSLDNVGKEVIITNNLFYDTFVAGADTDASRQAEFDESGEKDARNGLGKMFWIFSEPNDTTAWTVAGNYYVVSPAVQAFYESVAAEGVLGEGPPLTHHIMTRLGADSVNAFHKEAILLGNIPKDMVNMAVWYRSPDGGNKTKNTPCACWNRATDDFDRRPWQYFNDTLSCSYADTFAAAHGATDGGQVGDLNWPLVPVSGIVNADQGIPQAYKLNQNYPNPFNPVTKIAFTINKVDQVRLEIYNIMGQKITTLIDQKMKPGAHEVTWDASQVASGIYFYKFSYGSMTATRKMVLIR